MMKNSFESGHGPGDERTDFLLRSVYSISKSSSTILSYPYMIPGQKSWGGGPGGEGSKENFRAGGLKFS
jgi:hypothetical protein